MKVVSEPVMSFDERYEDLIPDNADRETYDSKRFSVITGSVETRDNSAIADVSVGILSHPEYGTVLTAFKLPH
ncbi:hypothetical protein QUF80_13175 [Desulfococcaceae bacterium HSG8]|nr:hypothetical protein [Desulfococcaceae bacterium HSG8]